MKTLARILILINFAVIIFVPGLYTNRLLLIPMFVLMVGLVAFYWAAMFWVSKKDVERVLGHEIKDDIFVGKIPADPSADLSRGRMCVEDGRLVLMMRTDDKTRRTKPCKEVWSIDLSEITSVGFGKVLSARKGFILYMGDDEVRFTFAKATKDRSLVYNLLGWKMENKQITEN